MGADRVIAVDIYCNEPERQATGALSVIGIAMRTQSCLLAAPEAAEADLLIRPVVSIPRMSESASQAAAIQAGYEAAREALVGSLAVR